MSAPATFRDLLNNWMSADAQMVTSFNEAHITEAPTPQAELAFANQRVNNMATALATTLRMLAERQDDGK